jgi:uncharacterized membrane protein YhaH (DUF805 family)
MSLGIGLYFIPLAMIANKSLIDLNTTFFLAILAFIKVALGLVMLSFSIISKKSLFLRLISLILCFFIIFI